MGNMKEKFQYAVKWSLNIVKTKDKPELRIYEKKTKVSGTQFNITKLVLDCPQNITQ